MISVASLDDLDEVVAVHQAAFPGFFMTQLGPCFLREYYRCVVECGKGILLAETVDGQCLGFVAGFADPAVFYGELRRRRCRLGIAALASVTARPWRLPIFVADYRRAGKGTRPQSGPPSAEISSLAVRPLAGGRGIGSRLVHAFVQVAMTAGIERIVLTTDTHDNEGGNRFYERLGFVCTRTFEARRGRWLNEYALVIRKD
jgi:ribosomal protein S18 acetylase RimI-like enzyme